MSAVAQSPSAIRERYALLTVLCFLCFREELGAHELIYRYIPHRREELNEFVMKELVPPGTTFLHLGGTGKHGPYLPGFGDTPATVDAINALVDRCRG